MRKFMLILMAVALLAGCVSTGSTQQVKQDQQRGTAEITNYHTKYSTVELIEKEYGGWVHILGTGIIFPLIGGWTDALIEDKEKTRFIVLSTIGDSEASFTAYVDKNNYPSMKNYVTTSNCSNIQAGFLNSQSQIAKSAQIVCNPDASYIEFIFHDSINNKVSIEYRGKGIMHHASLPLFLEMMRSIEINN